MIGEINMHLITLLLRLENILKKLRLNALNNEIDHLVERKVNMAKRVRKIDREIELLHKAKKGAE